MAVKKTVAQRLVGFMAGYAGRLNVGNTAANKGQCVGLVEVWGASLGLPQIWGNAADLLNDAPAGSYGRVDNAPVNYPAPGDIVVWGTNWGGGYGHTGIAVEANPNHLTVFQQNDPAGSAPHTRVYNYSGVLGWLHPLVAS